MDAGFSFNAPYILRDFYNDKICHGPLQIM